MTALIANPLAVLAGATVPAPGLNVNGTINAAGTVSAGSIASPNARIGAVGPAFAAGLLLGILGDTNLYRSAADTLRTSDSLIVDGLTTLTGLLTASGGIVATGVNTNAATLPEQGADPAALADAGKLYTKDVAGKTALFVRFPTGAAQQLAIEA